MHLCRIHCQSLSFFRTSKNPNLSPSLFPIRVFEKRCGIQQVVRITSALAYKIIETDVNRFGSRPSMKIALYTKDPRLRTSPRHGGQEVFFAF